MPRAYQSSLTAQMLTTSLLRGCSFESHRSKTMIIIVCDQNDANKSFCLDVLIIHAFIRVSWNVPCLLEVETTTWNENWIPTAMRLLERRSWLYELYHSAQVKLHPADCL